MIRVSLTAVPRRSRFLAAKAVVFTAVILTAGAVMAALARYGPPDESPGGSYRW